MSHNVLLNHVKITDLGILSSVVQELSNGKAKLFLDQKTFRTYAGQSNQCDHCIRMPGHHDIGVRSDGEGGFNLICDPYALDPVFSHEEYIDRDYNTNKLAALLQEYGIQQAEYQASLNGMVVTRTKAKDGSVVLECVSN